MNLWDILLSALILAALALAVAVCAGGGRRDGGCGGNCSDCMKRCDGREDRKK